MELFYRKTGNGNPFIIVHGLYGASDNWLSIGKKLGKTHTVYMLDQRNHGLSPHHDEHSFKCMKQDLAEFMDQHKIEKAVLLGHSMGGKVAMSFAADYPEKIERLIVADIAPKDYLLLNENSQYYLHRNILLAMIDIDFTQMESREDILYYLAEKIDDTRITQFLLKNVAKDKSSKLFKWRLNPEALYNYLDEIVGGVNKNWFSDLKPITNYPVKFIKGANSNYIQEGDFALIKEIYPDANIVTIPDAGHWLHAEQPKLFLKAITEYW